MLPAKKKLRSYGDIPRLLYVNKSIDLAVHNMNDTLLTHALFIGPDYFVAFDYHITIVKKTSCPWDLSISNKMSQPAYVETYKQNKMNGFLGEAILKPRTRQVKRIMHEIIDFFITGSTFRGQMNRVIS